MPRGETSIGGAGDSFPQTIGSLVQAVQDPKGVGYKAALNRFFLLYWRPVYAAIRKSGNPIEDAKDLTQDFMIELLDRGLLGRFDPAKGRLRAYLRGALKYFLASAKRRRRQDRVASWAIHPSRLAEVEGAGFVEELARYDADEIFDRQFSHEVVHRSLRGLKRALEAEGRKAHFKVLQAYDFPPPGDETPTYDSVAARFGLTPPEVRKHLEYARKRLDEAVRQTVAEYASGDEELAEELALIRRR